MEYGDRMEDLARAFEVIGVAIIALGAVYAIIAAVVDRPGRQLFKQTRRNFGQPFILGLEVLVAADIIETITVDRSFEAAAGVGGPGVTGHHSGFVRRIARSARWLKG